MLLKLLFTGIWLFCFCLVPILVIIEAEKKKKNDPDFNVPELVKTILAYGCIIGFGLMVICGSAVLLIKIWG